MDATVESLIALFKSWGGWGTFLAFLVAYGIYSLIKLSIQTSRQIVSARAFEESRRELAAYVAEGDMTAEQAAALLAVNAPRRGSAVGASCETEQDAAKRLGKAIVEHDLDSDDAALIARARERLNDEQFERLVSMIEEGVDAEDAVAIAEAEARGKSGSAGRAAPAMG